MCHFGIRAVVGLSVVVALLSGCTPDERRKWNQAWERGLGQTHVIGEKEPWTIECNSYVGENAGEMADTMASALKRTEGIDPDQVWVAHEADRSRVFYGTYLQEYMEAQTDGAEHLQGDVIVALGDEIKRDLRFIRSLAMGSQYPFFSARPLPKPIEDLGPSAWDLNLAQGTYTLQVGVTYNTPTLHNYKKAAVEWVRVLREDGWEAYYYHHPEAPKSSVCVGTFGPEALVDEGGGRTRYSDRVNALRKQADFMYNLENGHRMFRVAKDSETGEEVEMPNWSFLVKIPRDEATGASLENGGAMEMR